MQPALLGRKIGMTQVYDEAGSLQPVTVVQAGPCRVMQIKTVETDGYDAVQLGFETVRPQRAAKPQIGHSAKANARPARTYREVRCQPGQADVDLGQQVTVEVFQDIQWVDVTATSKGKGYAGVMKRHNFRGMSASHGTERMHRHGGSIASHGVYRGGSGGPKKGKRMSGRMGGERCTSRNHRLVAVDLENRLLLIKGSVPGPNGGVVFIRKSKTKQPAKA